MKTKSAGDLFPVNIDSPCISLNSLIFWWSLKNVLNFLSFSGSNVVLNSEDSVVLNIFLPLNSLIRQFFKAIKSPKEKLPYWSDEITKAKFRKKGEMK
jgi:hypothetical protein